MIGRPVDPNTSPAWLKAEAAIERVTRRVMAKVTFTHLKRRGKAVVMPATRYTRELHIAWGRNLRKNMVVFIMVCDARYSPAVAYCWAEARDHGLRFGADRFEVRE